MNLRRTNALVLEGVFDEKTVSNFLGISPAVNFWFKGFVGALESVGCEVELIGHAQDRMWPNGRLVVPSCKVTLNTQVSGKVIGYLNVPVVRYYAQALQYLRAVKHHVDERGPPQYVITFNDSPATLAAHFLKKFYGVKWVFISGDGLALAGADCYIYQNWEYFCSSEAPGPKIHVDGGLPNVGASISFPKKITGPRVLMYMGALSEHGGALELCRGFHSLSNGGCELWITGRGSNAEIEHLAAKDPRIKLFGFVSEQQLHELASKAWMFVNPRPTSFAPNELNYPSKLLHYLAYGRPVVSTFTPGLSPDYKNVLIPISDESVDGIASAINGLLSMSEDEYNCWCCQVSKFNNTRGWSSQAARTLDWLRSEVGGR